MMEPAECMGAVSSDLQMRYTNGSVTFSSQEKTSGPHKVPPMEYQPCIFLVEKNVPLCVKVSRKRKSTAEVFNERLWRDRKFTDATLSCTGRHIPVHRAILSA